MDEEINEVFEAVSKEYDADIIVYSGDIHRAGADDLANVTISPTNKNVILALCTPGGDPHAAFQMARRLQDRYDKFILYVNGICKSAGTFMAAGSDEIIMGDLAEFGPLDVQLSEDDEIRKFSSGLNIGETLDALRTHTTYFFKNMLVELTNVGISTKVAAEIASKLSTDLFNPIMSQIDPIKIGKVSRALSISLAYGERLNENNRGNIRSNPALMALVQNYPDHDFVIDFQEAQKLFKIIDKEKENIKPLGLMLAKMMRYPKNETTVIKFYPEESRNNETINQQRDSGRAAENENGKTPSNDEALGGSKSDKRAKKIA